MAFPSAVFRWARPKPLRWPMRFIDYVASSLAPIFGDANYRAKLQFFHRVLLFKDLPRRDLARFVQWMMEKTYGPGDIVFQEGELGRAFFVVAEGRVEVSRQDEGGIQSPVALFAAGDFFGEMVLLDELPRSATCRSLETTKLYIMYKDHFDHIIAHSPRAATPVLHALARLMSARLRREHRPLTKISGPDIHP